MKIMISVMHNIRYKRSNIAVEALRAAKQCSPPDTEYHARTSLVLYVPLKSDSLISRIPKGFNAAMAQG